jgi:hypothetical protein
MRQCTQRLLIGTRYATTRTLTLPWWVRVTRVKIEFLAAPRSGRPRSQENLPEPSAALTYEAQERNRRGVGPGSDEARRGPRSILNIGHVAFWEDALRYNRELRTLVESL